MKQLVIGMGEVGSAIQTILETADTFDILTSGSCVLEKYDVIHICFPYTKDFSKSVLAYQNLFSPTITIIHSSVPIGTSESLNAVYSPVRGVHPHIEKGIRIFVKFFGGMKAHEASDIFKEKGIRVSIVGDSRTLEAAKLWDTTQYGVMILLEKEIYKFCRKEGVDFETVYREFNNTYNEGYMQLGMEYVLRPSLLHKSGKIGGHCVVENAELLDSPSAKRIIEENKKL